MTSVNTTPQAPLGNLWLFIDRRMVQGQMPHETTTHLAARRALQALGVTIAGAGKYPFVAISKKAGGDNEAYGVALAYGNTASFAALISWALLNIIDDQMRPLSKEEAALLMQNMSGYKRGGILSASIVMGLISQTPFAYLAYVYNGKRVEMPVLMMLSDSWFPTYSTQLSINAALSQRSFSTFEKELSTIRYALIGLLEENRALLDKPEGRMDYVRALRAFKDNDAQDRPQAYMMHILEGRVATLSKEQLCCEGPKCVKPGDGLAWILGSAAFLSNMGAIGYISYIGWHQIYAEPGFDGTFAALAVGANLYVNGMSVPKTAVRLYNLAKSLLLCRYEPTLSDQLAPKLSFALKALGLATAALSYGPSVQISEDYFHGNSTQYGEYSNEGLATYMEIANSCATVLLTSTAILDIVDQIIELSLTKLGSEEAKQLVELNENMRRFSYLLAKSPLLEFAFFLKAAPPELFKKLVQDTQVSTDALSSYLSDHMADWEERQPLMLQNGATE